MNVCPRMSRPHDYDDFHEAVHVYDEIRCLDCPDPIDLSDAETTNDGIKIWNDHVRQEHPEMV